MDKLIYRKSFPYAIASMVAQLLLWLSALGILLKLGGEKGALTWRGISLLFLGFVIWIISAVSGINGMKTVEQSDSRNVETATNNP